MERQWKIIDMAKTKGKKLMDMGLRVVKRWDVLGNNGISWTVHYYLFIIQHINRNLSMETHTVLDGSTWHDIVYWG